MENIIGHNCTETAAGEHRQLCVTIPSFFRCPISLDVMTSPVSLCTGVTYDRSSIQRWLDSGNNFCPATMQPLPTATTGNSNNLLVPNHTLHRLIRLWLSRSSLSSPQASALVDHITSSFADSQRRPPSPDQQLLDPLLKLLNFASSAENWIFLARNDALVRILVRETRNGGEESDLDLVEAAVKLLDLIARSYRDDTGDESKLTKLRSLFLHPAESLASCGRILRLARPDAKIALSNLLQTLASADHPDAQIALVEDESILPQLILGINRCSCSSSSSSSTSLSSDPDPYPYPYPDPVPAPNQHHPADDSDTSSKSSPDSSSPSVAASYLSCLISLSATRRNRARIVLAGAISAVGRLLTRGEDDEPRGSWTTAYELALRLVEALCGCREGRRAIADDDRCLRGIVGRMMRVSVEASESAVAVLWGLCCVVKDERAKEAVAATGGLTRILLVMQSGCSPAAKRMCGDLLRVFRVGAAGSKTASSCLGSYDSKTRLIMPF